MTVRLRPPTKANMATSDLIAQAESAKTAKAASAAAVAADTATDSHNALTVTAAAQAVHDDLAVNGPYASVNTGPPLTVVVYAAVDPGDYSSTTVRTT